MKWINEMKCINVMYLAFGSQRRSHVSERQSPKLHMDVFSIQQLLRLVPIKVQLNSTRAPCG